jgi:hypothetical protein
MRLFGLFSLLIFTTRIGQAQDYVITWSNDTVYCVFPEKPGKEGMRPASKYENGHVRVLTFFPNDSVRVVEAGSIKGYYREKHGKSLLCNGKFISQRVRKEDVYLTGLARRDSNSDWFFMNEVHTGKHASLYLIYLHSGSQVPTAFYFVQKHIKGSSLDPIRISTRKNLVEIFSDPDIAGEMKPVLQKKGRKKYVHIIKEYNRLKEEAASKLR